jgi:excisionase family DNA binding protein
MNATEAVLIAIALKQANTSPAEVAPFLPQALELLELAEKELGPQVQLNGHELPRFMTIKQVSAVLALSGHTVYKLANEGRIPCTRPAPGILRFSTKVLEEHLRVRTTKPRRIKGIDAETTTVL